MLPRGAGGQGGDLSAGRVEAYTNRLYEKLKTILEDRSIDAPGS